MIIDLEKLSEAEEAISSEEVVDFCDFQGEGTHIKCSVVVSALRSGQLYNFKIHAIGSFETFCHKCLEPVEFPVESTFSVVVKRGGEKREIEATDEDNEYIYLPIGQNEVSLDSQIRENVVVSIPMQILCKPDCKGLCPRCGSNLNLEACGCKEDNDPRWNALRKLKNKLSN